jgi:hypothetical protein
MIGGADGLDPALRSEASRAIAFGSMVWPHMLARVMLSEQLYRAATILSEAPTTGRRSPRCYGVCRISWLCFPQKQQTGGQRHQRPDQEQAERRRRTPRTRVEPGAEQAGDVDPRASGIAILDARGKSSITKMTPATRNRGRERMAQTCPQAGKSPTSRQFRTPEAEAQQGRKRQRKHDEARARRSVTSPVASAKPASAIPPRPDP